MPQKIDVHGLFIDPETITDLMLQKRLSVSYPVFHEVETGKSFFGRFTSGQTHVLRFSHQQPFGIILADPEHPDPGSYVVNYQQAAIERFLRNMGNATKSIAGHITEMLKIEVSGDRAYRILQSGRNETQVSIRDIPAKVQLLNTQWVDVFKSSPGYDFQGGTPYAVTHTDACALMIMTKDRYYVLYGAGVDATNEEVRAAYQSLVVIYNEIQAKRDAKEQKPRIQMPQINIQLPKFELPKIEMPQIKFQSPFVFSKPAEKKEAEALPNVDDDPNTTDETK